MNSFILYQSILIFYTVVIEYWLQSQYSISFAKSVYIDDSESEVDSMLTDKPQAPYYINSGLSRVLYQ